MLANKLKRLRLRRNLQQKDLVEYLKVAKSTYSQYESGKSNPDYETLKKLAVFYNVSIDYLLDGDYHGKMQQSKDRITQEIGDGVEIHFRNANEKLTPEQVKIFKAFYKSVMRPDEEDKEENE